MISKQEYLRPHDVVVLLQLSLRPRATFRDLAPAIGLSLGETHNATRRLQLARLVAPAPAARVNRRGALEFLSFGVPYCFPAQVGGPARGVPTAFAVEPIASEVVGDEVVVWPSANGSARGLALVPLCPAFAEIWDRNPELYRLVSLVDAIRVGRARERASARKHLEKALRSAAPA